MLSKPVKIQIPANSFFKYGNCHCKSSAAITKSIINDWIFFQMQDATYLACKSADFNPDWIIPTDYQIVLSDDDNDSSDIGFATLSNLDTGYDSKILAKHETVSCDDMQIVANGELTVWKIVSYQVSDARCGKLQYEKQDQFQWITGNSKILTMNYQLMPQRLLYIKSGSKVKFGQLKYTLVHDVKLYLTNSIMSSYQYNNQFHLGAEVGELCANPFLKGQIIDQSITVRNDSNDSADIQFTIRSDRFAEKITKCVFYSNNMIVTGLNGPARNKAFTWNKQIAQAFYNKRRILKILQEFGWSVDSKIKALDSIKNNRKNFTEFATMAYNLAVTAGNLDIVKQLINDNSDTECYNIAMQSAIQNGKLEMVQYLFGLPTSKMYDPIPHAVMSGHTEILKYLLAQGAKFQSDFAQYLRMAHGKNHTEILEYLKNRPENIHHQHSQVMADVARLQASFQDLYQLLANK